ncbi:MAG: tetratricopeptide repeat protein [Deltaproteobacteria bacterium]|nr:tetratricopeptide repeat protein [Deltaproteobacteria bacterium]MBW2420391.1 tetratricopeptide repeat protein [Deltaproteobacteria bacterium]
MRPFRGVRPYLVVLLPLLLSVGCASFEAARLYQSGTEALDEGEVDRAIEELGRAAELAPDASEVHNHLGLALAADGREKAALLEFQRAVELDCENDAAQANLAVTRMRLGVQVEERQADADSRGEER